VREATYELDKLSVRIVSNGVHRQPDDDGAVGFGYRVAMTAPEGTYLTVAFGSESDFKSGRLPEDAFGEVCAKVLDELWKVAQDPDAQPNQPETVEAAELLEPALRRNKDALERTSILEDRG
jgi:hypothetical protein